MPPFEKVQKQEVIDAAGAALLVGLINKDECKKIIDEWDGTYYTRHDLTHACKDCELPITNLYYDIGLKVKVQDQLICAECADMMVDLGVRDCPECGGAESIEDNWCYDCAQEVK